MEAISNDLFLKCATHWLAANVFYFRHVNTFLENS